MTSRKTWLTGAALLATLALAGAPGAALAHVGAHEGGGCAHGFGHPLGGLDHVAAMVAVGLLAAGLGGRAVWAVPAAFVAMMLAGGLAGFAGVDLPYVEQGIGLSVIALGALVALGISMPIGLAMGLVGLFAVFHGHAHGAELPAGAAPAAFAAGFTLATALLHAAGVGAGLALARLAGPRGWASRALGAATVAVGVALVVF